MSTDAQRQDAGEGRPVDYGSRRGIDVKPGSILQARTEAGLSLAEVAGEEVSRVAIHRIERGKSRPTLRTLLLIAERTGRPLEWFIDSPHPESVTARDVMELEGLLAEERFQEAADGAGKLLARSRQREPKAALQLILGEALVWLGRCGEALDPLIASRHHFEQSGDGMREAAAMDWEAMALLMLGRPEALQVARRALERCRQLDAGPQTLEVRILTHIGSAHVFRREWQEAVTVYEEAIEVSGGVRDLRRMALMYANLAIAYGSSGQPERGLGYAHRALALHQLHRDRLSVARTHNNLAVIYLRLGRLEEAERSSRQAISQLHALGVEQQMSQFLLTLAEVHLAQERWTACEKVLDQARALSVRLQEPISLATTHQLGGRLADSLNDFARADRECSQALEILGREGASERLAECAVDYSRMLRRRGESEAACEVLERTLVGGPSRALREPSLRHLAG